MQLVVCPAYHEVALSGCGVIRSNETGTIYFRMVAEEPIRSHPVLERSLPIGTILQPDDQVMLVATDEHGREWRSNWFPPHVSIQFQNPSHHVVQGLRTLMHSRPVREHSTGRVELLIPGVPRLPFRRVTRAERRPEGSALGAMSIALDHDVLQIDGSEVVVRDEGDGWLSVIAERSEQFDHEWHESLLAALQFAIAQQLTPATVVRYTTDSEIVFLQSTRGSVQRGAMPGPVIARPESHGPDLWSLVEKLATQLLQHPAEAERIMRELDGIRRGAEGSFQTACLTLGVGVESLTGLILPDPVPDQNATVHVESLVAHIRDWTGDPKMIDRAVSSLQNAFRSVSASERLRSWAGRAPEVAPLHKQWKNLRHRAAHGVPIKQEQEDYDCYYSVVELLYRMVARFAGYDGALLNPSQPGWGIEQLDDDRMSGSPEPGSGPAA